MKNVLAKFFIVMGITSLGISGCSSTNTQSQNTGAGAVSGGILGGIVGSTIGGGAGKAVAVGVGAIAGALLGGYIGHSMDSSDKVQMNQALNNDQPTSWTNKKTGASYTVRPTSQMMTVNGNPNCRRYQTTAVVDGKQKQMHGVACKQSDGSWMAVN